MNPERYHLTLTTGDQRMMQGWWGNEAIARGKFTEWVGSRGKAGARVTLVDEETGKTLTTWPKKP